jgi:hypothetical protein
MALIIREGSISDVEQFAHFSAEDTDGTFTVAELNGQVVGFMQRAGSTVYNVESNEAGVGSALINWLKERFDCVTADNVQKTAEGFWSKMGFQRDDSQRGMFSSGPIWNWYEGE